MGCYSGPEIVNDGLVLHLDAANSKSYPGSGTVWTDLSGLGNHGTLVNGVGYNNGNMILDASNDLVYINNLTNQDFLTTFTLDCVFYQKNSSNPGPLMEKYNWATSGKGGWGVRFNGGNLRFFTTDNSKSDYADIGYSLNVSMYYHISVTYSNSVVNIYVNGVNVKQQTMNVLPTSTIGKPLYIGQRGDGSGAYNYVNISKSSMYNRALTAQEIQQNFNATRGRYGI